MAVVWTYTHRSTAMINQRAAYLKRQARESDERQRAQNLHFMAIARIRRLKETGIEETESKAEHDADCASEMDRRA